MLLVEVASAAALFANVSTTDAGGIGEIVSVDIVNPGVNYTDEPIIDTNPVLDKPDTYFAIYTKEFYGSERGTISYTTSSSLNVIGTSATIDVVANGVGYDKLPEHSRFGEERD